MSELPYEIKWDESGKRFYETGVKNAVLYVQNSSGTYPKGVAWNGITSISESPSGGEANDLYADDMKYLSLLSAETFGATVEAYTYPDEFAECDGSVQLTDGLFAGQQDRKSFGLVYKTTLGNDVSGNALGYKLHLIYGCKAAPSEKAYSTINDSPEAITFSWELNTTPVTVTGFKPTSCLVIDSTKADSTKLAALERKLYGSEADPEDPQSTAVDGYLPLPDEVKSTLTPASAGT